MVLLSSSCTLIKDEPLYFDEGISGAVEMHFLSPGSTDIDKPTWDKMREGMVCMSTSSFGDYKAEIEKLCTKCPCDWETQAMIADFLIRLEEVKSHAVQR